MFHDVRNIVCDLGGVLYAIDYQRTFRALLALSQQAATEPLQLSLTKQSDVFSRYEMGLISTVEFRQEVGNFYHINSSDQEFDQAWNALLLYLIPDSLANIKQLQSTYRLALLSNINELHYHGVADECQELFSHFEKCFLSYQCFLRKPNPEIFELVLREMNFSPKETLFIDDSNVNIAAAQAIGLQTYLVDEQNSLQDLVYKLEQYQKDT